ncbi:DsbA family oxidoreductase [Sphaerisporangium sp. NPDC051017]|uniref:DsbA family oxidoreductase n=1 Tax=Sphaerisporangium sp. NPDC051017 TaxID=3154636 RepID=UPI0034334ED1
MKSAVTARVAVDVWVDVQCSWCYLNKRRLDAAIAEAGVPVDVRYHFFQLGPDAPDRIDKERFLREERGMDEATLRQGQAHLNRLGSEYGISYDWDRMLPTNSRRAHRLLSWAQEEGRRSEMLDRAFRAYFTEGADLADPDTLARLAADAGLDASLARAVVDSDERDDSLERDRAEALRLGLTGVPLIVIAQRYGLSGAQSVEALTGILRRAASEAAHG